MNQYDDIINLPHHISETHPPMSPTDRAAQFSPFAALNGYEDAVEEVIRVTEQQLALTEESKGAIDRKLGILQRHLADQPEVTITYFKLDERKSGGAYLTVSGMVKKLDRHTQTVVLADETQILF